MISSTSNSQVKQAAALGQKARLRKETGLFVAEGARLFGELPKERVEKVYVTDRFLADPARREALKGTAAGKVEQVTQEVMKAMSGTQAPQGIFAIVRQFGYTMADLKKAGHLPLLLILETIQDPGNLGTILRAGEGAGVTGVVMDRNTADVYNPKVIRSTMGSVCRVPFLYVENLPQVMKSLKQEGIFLYASHVNGENSYDQEDYKKPVGFLIGNEARGLKEETAALADAWVRIPMEGKVESLNAAVASAVLMFEAARQRREGCRKT